MPLGIKIALVAIPLLAVALLLPVVQLTLLNVFGKTFQCSLSQTLDAGHVGGDRQQRSRAIKASAQEIQSDKYYSLWRTRDGDYWIPNRDAETLTFNLAEQEQDIYGQGGNGVHSGDVVLDGGANVGVHAQDSECRRAQSDCGGARPGERGIAAQEFRSRENLSALSSSSGCRDGTLARRSHCNTCRP
jgi:hypothetical protein